MKKISKEKFISNKNNIINEKFIFLNDKKIKFSVEYKFNESW